MGIYKRLLCDQLDAKSPYLQFNAIDRSKKTSLLCCFRSSSSQPGTSQDAYNGNRERSITALWSSASIVNSYFSLTRSRNGEMVLSHLIMFAIAIVTESPDSPGGKAT